MYDATEAYPYLFLKSGETAWAKLSKTVIESLSRTNSPCSTDEETAQGFQECRRKVSSEMVLRKMSCRLPWIQAPGVRLCNTTDEVLYAIEIFESKYYEMRNPEREYISLSYSYRPEYILGKK